MSDVLSSGLSRPAATTLPRRRLADLIVAVWRERATALVILAALSLLGVAVAFLQRPTYSAEARLLVRLGQEYVFQPQVGSAGSGAFPLLQQVVNSETRILQSPEIARRVVEAKGVGALFPEIAREERDPAKAVRAAERALEKGLGVTTTPETPIISLTFQADDPQRAASILNTLIDTYLTYRRDVLVGEPSDELANQTSDFEVRAKKASVDVQAFLAGNGVGDFDAELKALGELQSRLDSELVEARARRRELESQAASLNGRTRNQPAAIELFSESDSAKRLVDLKLERSQLLGRYLPNSQPIREIDTRIAELEAAVAQAEPGTIRRGPNPVRQEIEREFFQAEASARAQASREQALETQRSRTMERLRVLQGLEPQFRALVRERTILEDNARTFRARAEEAAAFKELSNRTDTVRAVERASPPSQARSQRFLIAMGGVLLGLVLGLVAAMLRGVLRDRFATPTEAGRRLNLPVLAVTHRGLEGAGAPA